MRVYIEKNGCKRRLSEVSRLRKYFTVNGYEIVSRPEEAEHIILATCAFKKDEEEYSLKRLSVLKENKADLLVYGCLPDIAPSKMIEYKDVKCISPKNIHEIDACFDNIKIKFSEVGEEEDMTSNLISTTSLKSAFSKLLTEFNLTDRFVSRSLKYAKKRIDEVSKHKQKYYLFTSAGCLGDCTYCAIRLAIGTIRSKSTGHIVSEFKKGANAGYHNFVISGDDAGAYGLDTKNGKFPDLLSILINESDIYRDIGFHIEEIHPKWVISYQDRIMDMFASKKVKSLLCPIQSGNDRILGLMKRHHSAQDIFDALIRIRDSHPEVDLSTQIMVGFPSETEDEFNDTLLFLKKLHFDSVVIFPYHEKENTPAAKLDGKIDERTIEQRVMKAIEFLKQNKIEWHLSCP